MRRDDIEIYRGMNMPYKTTKMWIEPELFLEHKGIKVYHVYEDDDIENHTCVFTYTLYNIEDIERNFDVRKLNTYKGNDFTITMNDIKNTIIQAIDAGELKLDQHILSEETKRKLGVINNGQQLQPTVSIGALTFLIEIPARNDVVVGKLDIDAISDEINECSIYNDVEIEDTNISGVAAVTLKFDVQKSNIQSHQSFIEKLVKKYYKKE